MTLEQDRQSAYPSSHSTPSMDSWSTILLSGPSKRIAEIGEGDQESMLVDQFSSGLTLESTLGFNVLPEQRRITLSVTVEAEIDEAGFDKRQFGGLRIVSPNDT